MDWLAFIKAHLPEIVSIFKTTTAPPPIVPEGTETVTIKKKPSEAVRHLQHVLNQLSVVNPPLREDGWLGDKTEKAIEAGLAMAEPYLLMLGK